MLSRERYVILGTVGLAFLAALALGHALNWTWIQIGLDNPFLLGVRELELTRVLGYGIAIAGAVFVLKHGPTHQLASEVVEELSKVTWPSREETGNATIVVIAAVVICSVYLGAFDWMWLTLTNWILGIKDAPQG
jgi:preprotein translocase SecE subunit